MWGQGSSEYGYPWQPIIDKTHSLRLVQTFCTLDFTVRIDLGESLVNVRLFVCQSVVGVLYALSENGRGRRCREKVAEVGDVERRWKR